MTILIQDDGIIIPFGIQSSRETKFTLMPETRDSTDEKEAADGDIDFGTVYGMGEFVLHGVIELEADDDKNSIVDTLKGQFNECRVSQELVYECDPSKSKLVRLTGKPEINENLHYLEIRAQFKADPFWLNITESSLIGVGTVVNAGTFECPILIEIPGPATNPSVSVGASVIAYTSTVAAGQKLVIDTNAQTAYIGSVNAMANISGSIDYMLAPGISVAVTPSISTIAVKWRDRYL